MFCIASNHKDRPKSSSTGPQFGGKTAETAPPKWTEMVQKPTPYILVCFLREYLCQISDTLKIVGQHIMMPPDHAPLRNTFLKSYEITMDRLSDASHPRIFCLNEYNCKKE